MVAGRSLGAGTGLHLTAASYVVLFDPWWNLAVEARAIDRTVIGRTLTREDLDYLLDPSA